MRFEDITEEFNQRMGSKKYFALLVLHSDLVELFVDTSPKGKSCWIHLQQLIDPPTQFSSTLVYSWNIRNQGPETAIRFAHYLARLLEEHTEGADWKKLIPAKLRVIGLDESLVPPEFILANYTS